MHCGCLTMRLYAKSKLKIKSWNLRMRITKKFSPILFIFIFFTLSCCSVRTQINHNYDNKRIVIEFLDKEEASNYFLQSNFVKRMNHLNISIRMDKDIPKDDIEGNISAYKKFIADNLKNWSGYEINIINDATEQVINELNDFAPAVLPDTLYFVKTSMGLEFNAFFTLNNIICVPTSVIWPILFKEMIKETIAHEMFHIYSRNNKAKRDSIYELFNFFYVDTLDVGEYLESKMIINPDVHSNNYILRLEDTTGTIKNLFLSVQLDEDKYNKDRWVISFLGATNIFDYFTAHLYELFDSDNAFTLTNKENPPEYDWNLVQNSFNSTCGCLTKNRYFAEEIAAEAFIFCLKANKDLDNLEDCNFYDKVIIEKFINIIRN